MSRLINPASRTYAVLAVQGTMSDEVLAAAGLPAGHDYMSFVSADDQDGAPVTVCRTGYTGERGYELVVPVEAADGGVGRRSLAAGGPTGCSRPDSGHATRCGPRWATRCMVRTSRRPSPRCRPGSAGQWVGRRNRSSEPTRSAPRRRGPARLLRGLRAVGRGIPRPGMIVRASGRPRGSARSPRAPSHRPSRSASPLR